MEDLATLIAKLSPTTITLSPTITYQAPTYHAPTYHAPQAPTYQAPTYQAPQAPTYEGPTYQGSTYEGSTYHAPSQQPVDLSEIRKLIKELAELKNAPPNAPVDTAVVAKADTALSALREELADLKQRLDQLETKPAPATQQEQEKLAREIQGLTEQKKQDEQAFTKLQTDVDELKGRMTIVEGVILEIIKNLTLLKQSVSELSLEFKELNLAFEKATQSDTEAKEAFKKATEELQRAQETGPTITNEEYYKLLEILQFAILTSQEALTASEKANATATTALMTAETAIASNNVAISSLDEEIARLKAEDARLEAVKANKTEIEEYQRQLEVLRTQNTEFGESVAEFHRQLTASEQQNASLQEQLTANKAQIEQLNKKRITPGQNFVKGLASGFNQNDPLAILLGRTKAEIDSSDPFEEGIDFQIYKLLKRENILTIQNGSTENKGRYYTKYIVVPQNFEKMIKEAIPTSPSYIKQNETDFKKLKEILKQILIKLKINVKEKGIAQQLSPDYNNRHTEQM